jgi:hypothetical protein
LFADVVAHGVVADAEVLGGLLRDGDVTRTIRVTCAALGFALALAPRLVGLDHCAALFQSREIEHGVGGALFRLEVFGGLGRGGGRVTRTVRVTLGVLIASIALPRRVAVT